MEDHGDITQRLAILNCKKTKKPYKCTVREMYSDSVSFKLQMIVVDELYDGQWALISTKHGILMPDDVIEPYDVNIYTPSKSVKEYLGVGSEYINKSTERNQYGENVAQHPIWQDTKYEAVDCWLADLYWMNMYRKLKPAIPVNWVRPVVSGRGIGPALKAQKQIAERIRMSRFFGEACSLDTLYQDNLIYRCKQVLPKYGIKRDTSRK